MYIKHPETYCDQLLVFSKKINKNYHKNKFLETNWYYLTESDKSLIKFVNPIKSSISSSSFFSFSLKIFSSSSEDLARSITIT